MVLGEFNSILSQDDMHKGGVVSTYETIDFNTCCLDLGLCDLNYTGYHFTRSNGNVWSKIDRVLFSPTLSSLQKQVHVHFGMSGAFSDHSLATVRFDHQRNRHCSFKSFNMWTSHENFLAIVSESWSLNIFGSPMYTFCQRLKFLKNPLKELNKLHFIHISQIVARAELSLNLHQVLFMMTEIILSL